MLPFNFITSIRFKTKWEQRSMWRTYIWDIGGISKEEADQLQDEILKAYNEDSKDLACLYDTNWYTEGAWKQAILDEQVYFMLFLLHHHSGL